MLYHFFYNTGKEGGVLAGICRKSTDEERIRINNVAEIIMLEDII
jgi:hypothetical protein